MAVSLIPVPIVVIVLVLLAGAVHLRARARERKARRDFPPEGQFVAVDGLRVHAVVAGCGPDLVLIHGSSGNTRDFTFSFLDTIKDRYRVIIFDRPGLGWSDRLPHGRESIHNQAAHLRKAAQALGVGAPIVLGQSYGAAVAMAWALDAPGSVAAVVNVAGPSHPWSGPLPWFYRISSNPLGSALIVPLITAFVSSARVASAISDVFYPQRMPDGYADHIGAPLSLRRDALRANARHRATLKEEIMALVPRYGHFPVPLEIVHGTKDTTVDLMLHAGQMAEATEMAHFTTLPGIGHMPQQVAQEQVAAAIDRAAARVAARTGLL